VIAVLAVAAQVFIGVARGVLFTENLEAQIGALIVVSALIVGLCILRDRRERELAQARSVATVAQRVLLQPLPGRSGPLHIASLYLAAEDEAEMGGDLFAAARTETGTRLLVGDVRGKGLPAYSHAALLLGAFRAAAHRQASLTALAVHLDGAMRWDTHQWEDDAELDVDESFATATLLDIPDDDHVLHAINCGHPPPLLLRDGQVTPLQPRSAALPIGLGGFADPRAYEEATVPFHDGDLLLLYTDGVTEARNAHGEFYPLDERAAAWTGDSPDALLRHLHHDLANYAHGHLADDVAVVAIRRTPAT
jgi:serine phosphatase RsbU (regulator of sigma subunit)